MMLTTIQTEYNSPDFSVSYDAKFDILRLNNKAVGHFSYEEVEDNLLIMIEDDTNEIVGAQMLDVLSKKEQALESIHKLKYNNLKKALYKSFEVIDNK